MWPLAKLLALVPLTLGGLGIREAGLVALLAPFGAPATLAVATGLAWESIIIAGGLVAGSDLVPDGRDGLCPLGPQG